MAVEENNSIIIDSEEGKDIDQPTDENTQPSEQEEKAKEEAPKEDIKPEDVDQENVEEVTKALQTKGFDYEALTEEYMSTGALSEKTMADLNKVGITKDIVDNYIAGCNARMEAERNELAEVVGGREQMDSIIDWAAHNLSKEEIISINAIRDKYQLKNTLIGLKNRMEEKEGVIPKYQDGDGGKAGVAGFRSQAEMFEAIKDPKYSKDPAYRHDVQMKVQASREAGIDLGIY